MGITYNAGTNTVTVTGYTEAVPCTFQDLWNADQLGGWGKISKQCLNQFCIDCLIIIGDGTISTWFADTTKQIVYIDGWIPLYSTLITVTLNGHFRLGKHISGNRTEYGCAIFILENSNAHIPIGGTYPSPYAPNVELYGTTIASYEGVDCNLQNLAAPKIYECRFDSCYLFRLTDADIKNVTLLNTIDGLSAIEGTLDDIFIHTNGSAIWFEAGTITVSGGVFRSNSDIVNAYPGSATAYLIDCDVDVWHFDFRDGYTGNVYRQNKFDLKLIQDNEARTPISGMPVKIWDKDNTLVTDTVSDINGDIPTQTLYFGYYNKAGGDTPVMKTPHKILVGKAGTTYQIISTYMYMDYKRREVLALTKQRPIQFCDGEPILKIALESEKEDRYLFTKI